MKKLLIITTLFLITFSLETSFAQTTRTVSAKCGKCGKNVPTTAKVGDYCPNCGIRWGYSTSTEKQAQTNRSNISASEFRNTNNNPYNESTYSIFENETMTIRNCYLYSQPNPKSVKIGILNKNSKITLIKRRYDWIKISYLGYFEGNLGTFYGWIHSSNIVE